MTNSGTLLTFILVSFAFALVLIFKKKDSIPHRAKKRPMALLALVMIVLAFGFIVYSFFTMSQ